MQQKLTLSRRQLRALLGLARMEAGGTRFGLADAEEVRRPGGFITEATEESHLTHEEMRDLHLRLQDYLYPWRPAELEVEVEVAAEGEAS